MTTKDKKSLLYEDMMDDYWMDLKFSLEEEIEEEEMWDLEELE